MEQNEVLTVTLKFSEQDFKIMLRIELCIQELPLKKKSLDIYLNNPTSSSTRT